MKIAIGVMVTALSALLSGFFVMLAFHLVHNQDDAIPPLGYWTSLVISLAVFSLVRGARAVPIPTPVGKKGSSRKS